MEYIVKFSNRKSIGIYVKKDASVEVRCPFRTSKKVIEELIEKKSKWINNARNKMILEKTKEFTEEEKIRLLEKGKQIIPEKVIYFSKIMNVKPTSVRIGNSKSYWGCCSGNNRLNFSWRLMQASDDVIDYVVVHELAHIKEHNHSKKFWREVEKILPDYKDRIQELKKLD